MAYLSKNRFGCLVVALMALAVLCIEKSTAALDGSDGLDQPRESLSLRDSPSARTEEGSKRRLREGTVVSDQSGYFREDGDGATFVADSSWEFGALPNLNLERVVRQLKNAEEPQSIRWIVSGQVTEFAGRNFLLISRAVYKAATPPPTPERIDR